MTNNQLPDQSQFSLHQSSHLSLHQTDAKQIISDLAFANKSLQIKLSKLSADQWEVLCNLTQHLDLGFSRSNLITQIQDFHTGVYAVSYGFSGEELVEFLVTELNIDSEIFSSAEENAGEFTSQLLASYLAFLRINSPEKLIQAMVKLEYIDLLPGITNLLGSTPKESLHRIREQLKPILVASQDFHLLKNPTSASNIVDKINSANTTNIIDTNQLTNSTVSIDLSNWTEADKEHLLTKLKSWASSRLFPENITNEIYKYQQQQRSSLDALNSLNSSITDKNQNSNIPTADVSSTANSSTVTHNPQNTQSTHNNHNNHNNLDNKNSNSGASVAGINPDISALSVEQMFGVNRHDNCGISLHGESVELSQPAENSNSQISKRISIFASLEDKSLKEFYQQEDHATKAEIEASLGENIQQMLSSSIYLDDERAREYLQIKFSISHAKVKEPKVETNADTQVENISTTKVENIVDTKVDHKLNNHEATVNLESESTLLPPAILDIVKSLSLDKEIEELFIASGIGLDLLLADLFSQHPLVRIYKARVNNFTNDKTQAFVTLEDGRSAVLKVNEIQEFNALVNNIISLESRNSDHNSQTSNSGSGKQEPAKPTPQPIDKLLNLNEQCLVAVVHEEYDDKNPKVSYLGKDLSKILSLHFQLNALEKEANLTPAQLSLKTKLDSYLYKGTNFKSFIEILRNSACVVLPSGLILNCKASKSVITNQKQLCSLYLYNSYLAKVNYYSPPELIYLNQLQAQVQINAEHPFASPQLYLLPENLNNIFSNINKNNRDSISNNLFSTNLFSTNAVNNDLELSDLSNFITQEELRAGVNAEASQGRLSGLLGSSLLREQESILQNYHYLNSYNSAHHNFSSQGNSLAKPNNKLAKQKNNQQATFGETKTCAYASLSLSERQIITQAKLVQYSGKLLALDDDGSLVGNILVKTKVNITEVEFAGELGISLNIIFNKAATLIDVDSGSFAGIELPVVLASNRDKKLGSKNNHNPDEQNHRALKFLKLYYHRFFRFADEEYKDRCITQLLEDLQQRVQVNKFTQEASEHLMQLKAKVTPEFIKELSKAKDYAKFSKEHPEIFYPELAPLHDLLVWNQFKGLIKSKSLDSYNFMVNMLAYPMVAKHLKLQNIVGQVFVDYLPISTKLQPLAELLLRHTHGDYLSNYLVNAKNDLLQAELKSQLKSKLKATKKTVEVGVEVKEVEEIEEIELNSNIQAVLNDYRNYKFFSPNSVVEINIPRIETALPYKYGYQYLLKLGKKARYWLESKTSNIELNQDLKNIKNSKSNNKQPTPTLILVADNTQLFKQEFNRQLELRSLTRFITDSTQLRHTQNISNSHRISESGWVLDSFILVSYHRNAGWESTIRDLRFWEIANPDLGLYLNQGLQLDLKFGRGEELKYSKTILKRQYTESELDALKKLLIKKLI